LFFICPATQQSIPYLGGSYKTSNTWVNTNTKPNGNAQPSAMMMKSTSQGNANILVQASMLLVNHKT